MTSNFARGIVVSTNLQLRRSVIFLYRLLTVDEICHYTFSLDRPLYVRVKLYLNLC